MNTTGSIATYASVLSLHVNKVKGKGKRKHGSESAAT